MTKDELKEKIKSIVNNIYNPETLTGKEEITLDAPKFPLFDQRTPARYFMLIGFAVGFVISLFYALYKYTEN